MCSFKNEFSMNIFPPWHVAVRSVVVLCCVSSSPSDPSCPLPVLSPLPCPCIHPSITESIFGSAVFLFFQFTFLSLIFLPLSPRALSYSQDIKVIHTKDLTTGLFTVPKYNHFFSSFHFCYNPFHFCCPFYLSLLFTVFQTLSKLLYSLMFLFMVTLFCPCLW